MSVHINNITLLGDSLCFIEAGTATITQVILIVQKSVIRALQFAYE